MRKTTEKKTQSTEKNCGGRCGKNEKSTKNTKNCK